MYAREIKDITNKQKTSVLATEPYHLPKKEMEKAPPHKKEERKKKKKKRKKRRKKKNNNNKPTTKIPKRKRRVKKHIIYCSIWRPSYPKGEKKEVWEKIKKNTRRKPTPYLAV